MTYVYIDVVSKEKNDNRGMAKKHRQFPPETNIIQKLFCQIKIKDERLV